MLFTEQTRMLISTMPLESDGFCASASAPSVLVRDPQIPVHADPAHGRMRAVAREQHTHTCAFMVAERGSLRGSGTV
eukprot:12064419-Alexandrium_andersonii.AAC.1